MEIPRLCRRDILAGFPVASEVRMRKLPLAICLALSITSGCSPERPDMTALTSPGVAIHLGVPSISGRMLGPDGTSLCNFLFPGAAVTMRAIRFGGNGSTAATQTVFCPSDAYDLPSDSGSFALRVQSLGFQTFAAIPDRYIDLGPIVVPPLTDVVHDLQVQYGLPLGGGATIDGAPLGNLPVTVSYASLLGFGAAFGVSDTFGLWQETTGRSPFLLQSDQDFVFTGCSQLTGTTLVNSFPIVPVHFPVPVGSVSCDLATSLAAKFTHTSSGVIVGALPGDIGGLSLLPGSFGLGYGVQFSDPLPHPPAKVGFDVFPLHLFRGGLLLGVSSSTVLSGVDLAGFTTCSISCRDFGRGATGRLEKNGPGLKVTWGYSDDYSPQRMGLGVVQTSIDGPAGKRYVLFRFRLTNQRSLPITLAPGLFMDWDVDGFGGDDLGQTALNGQLMYVSNDDGSGTPIGTAVGTMVFVATRPSVGDYFFTVANGIVPIASVYDALTGVLQQPSFGLADIQYVQGGSSLRIPARGSRDVWVVVVVGADVNELLANAQDASNQVHRLIGNGIPVGGGLLATVTVPFDGPMAPSPSPSAKSPLTARDP